MRGILELVVIVACVPDLSPNEMKTLGMLGSEGKSLRDSLGSLKAVGDRSSRRHQALSCEGLRWHNLDCSSQSC